MKKLLCFLSLGLLVAARALAAPAPAPRNAKSVPAISLANLGKVQKLHEFSREAWRTVWGPRPGQLALVGWQTPVEIVDDRTFRVVESLAPDKKLIHFAASRDWGRVAWGENNTKVDVYDRKTHKLVILETKNDQPGSAFSPDGKLLATGGYGTAAKLWDAATGKEVRAFKAGAEGGLRVVFSPDGKLLAIGNRNDASFIYEVATGKLLHQLPLRMSHELKFSPDGRTLAVAYVDGQVGLWDPASGKRLFLGKSGAREVYTLDWSPRGDVLVSAGSRGKIVLWDPRNMTAARELEAPDFVHQVRFSPDGDRFVSAGGFDPPKGQRKVVIWGLP